MKGEAVDTHNYEDLQRFRNVAREEIKLTRRTNEIDLIKMRTISVWKLAENQEKNKMYTLNLPFTGFINNLPASRYVRFLSPFLKSYLLTWKIANVN